MLVQVEHHFVHDGWSLSVLLKELQEVYSAFSNNRPSPLTELNMQFADYAVWQRHQLETDGYKRELAFWQNKLQGPIPSLDLPYDYPRPQERTNKGSQIRMTLSADDSEALRQLAHQEGVTLYVIMLATFYCLLYRYSGQEDIWLGTGVANRQTPDVERLIGMVINTSVLRGDLRGNPTFRTLLLRIKQLTQETILHQSVPFDKVVDLLKPTRVPGKNPLFQVLFGFHDNPVPDLRFPDLLGKVEYPHNQTAKFDMNVIIIPRAEQCLGLAKHQISQDDRTISIFWEYSTDLFSSTTVTRMMTHYMSLLKSVVPYANQVISRLPMLSEQEKHQVLQEWNATTRTYPQESSIPVLFEEQAKLLPEAVPVVSGEQHLTYGQLNAQANQVAHYLRKRGVGPDVLVGLCCQRGIEMVTGLLGILKAGGAYVPLDPAYPQQRLAYMLSDTQTPILVTQESIMKSFPSPDAQVVCLDRDWHVIRQEPETDLPHHNTGANLAYVIYTSGSTGRPKGTLIPHRAVGRLVKSPNYVTWESDDIILQFAPISFDASTFEIWGSLLNGLKLAIFPPHTPSLEELGRFIGEQHITTLWFTSALFNQMVDTQLDQLGSVRQLLAGGDVLNIPHVQKVLSTLNGNRHLINGYGPTENTTFTCCHVMKKQTKIGLRVPIGQAISNTTVYILDRDMQPVPVGAPGDLYIGGEGLARGYLQRPDLTAQKFLPHPFCQDQASRLYQTGDRARHLSNGLIEFLGRQDHQVKVRGFRIELGEIQSILCEHTAISQSVVMIREDIPDEKRLIAYLIWEDGKSATDEEIRQFLESRVPGYMIPYAFIPLENWPLSPNGKLDREALPHVADRPPSNQFLAPESETEKALAAMWCDLLHLNQIGTLDNFFHVGGHSLMGTQLLSRLRETFDLELPLSCIFEYPTISQMSKYLDATIYALQDTGQVPHGCSDREEGEL